MKFLIVAVCMLAGAFAVENKDAQILKSNYELNPDGSYQIYVEADNGIKQKSSATFKRISEKEGAVVVQGSSSYVAPDGQTYELVYTADENGFQPQGAHLPTPPAPQPIPDYIARSIEYIKAHPYKEPTVLN